MPLEGKLLEVGCGIGLACELLSPSMEYTGIDVSPHLLELAREQNPSRKFILGDATTDLKNYQDRHFDLCILRSAVNTLKWCGAEIYEATRQELLRVCRVVVIQEYTEDYYTLMRRNYDENHIRR